jgi:4,5-DOPA dioxygenase extradiol
MTTKTPILFIGHGSPMNAIEQNQYTESWRKIGESIPKPRAILMFSAHWITEHETRISTCENPDMIYDMGGFPPELYHVRYDAPWSRQIAKEIIDIVGSFRHVEAWDILLRKDEQSRWAGSVPLSLHSKWQKKAKITPDPTRGFDHGVWSTLIHLFPAADVPVITMSLDYRASARELVELGDSLAILRESGILIIGSGNIVHNLGAIDWSGQHIHPWATEFDARIATWLTSGKNSPEWESLLDFRSWGDISRLAHPSYDHLLPLFPLMGASSANDVIEFYTPDIAMGSLSMRSIRWHS